MDNTTLFLLVLSSSVLCVVAQEHVLLQIRILEYSRMPCGQAAGCNRCSNCGGARAGVHMTVRTQYESFSSPLPPLMVGHTLRGAKIQQHNIKPFYYRVPFGPTQIGLELARSSCYEPPSVFIPIVAKTFSERGVAYRIESPDFCYSLIFEARFACSKGYHQCSNQCMPQPCPPPPPVVPSIGLHFNPWQSNPVFYGIIGVLCLILLIGIILSVLMFVLRGRNGHQPHATQSPSPARKEPPKIVPYAPVAPVCQSSSAVHTRKPTCYEPRKNYCVSNRKCETAGFAKERPQSLLNFETEPKRRGLKGRIYKAPRNTCHYYSKTPTWSAYKRCKKTSIPEIGYYYKPSYAVPVKNYC